MVVAKIRIILRKGGLSWPVFFFPVPFGWGSSRPVVFHSIMFRRMENFTMAMAVMLVRGMSCGE